ncbi:MAG: flavodoxin family protein [Aquificae bacterium]|nr:flavodoxin family protein [Aquificota bacterium]
MGKVLVLYDTETGHTGKMAEYVAKGAKKYPVEVRLKSVDEATKEDILWCDGIAVGSPTYLGVMSWKMKKFWDSIVDLWGNIDGKIGCAFSSSGGWGGGNEVACMSILTMLMNYGFLVFGVTDYVGDKFTLHYGAVVAGEPRTEEEIKACERLGERLAQWVLVYVDGKKEYLEEIRNKE